MARAITSEELTRFRADGQYTELYLAVFKPEAVFSCRLNGTPANNDGLMELIYDGASGDYTDVRAGMTCYVGSSAGAYDKGMVRIRADASATVLYIGQASDIVFTDNDYLTVTNEFNLWPKHLQFVTGDTWLVDGEAYSDQHVDMDPLVSMGPLVAVVELLGADVAFTPQSVIPYTPGAGLTSYLHSIITGPAAVTVEDDDTDQPTFTFTEGGWYCWACEITADNGKSTTCYRYIFVEDADNPLTSQFELEDAPKSSDGGYSFAVRAFAEAGLDAVRERTLCALVAKDWYDGERISIGPVEGYENIVSIGWIEEESITPGENLGEVTFSISGPQHWLSLIDGYATGVKDSTIASTSWLFVEELTIDLGLWHFLHHRSTASLILDISLSGDARRISATEAGEGQLWDQVKAIAEPIFAAPNCDRYGRMFVEVDPQNIPDDERGSIPVVMDITSDDWEHDSIDVQRRPINRVSLLESSGVTWNGTISTPLFSLAPGGTKGRYGKGTSRDRLLITDQDQLNELCALYFAQQNNEYPQIKYDLATNNRMIDIAPVQYVRSSLAAGDTPRGIVWTNKKQIPRRIEYAFENNMLSVNIECEAETFSAGVNSVTYIPPQPPSVNVQDDFNVSFPDYPLSPLDNVYFPVIIPQNPTIPGGGGTCSTDTDAAQNGPFSLYFDNTTIYSEPGSGPQTAVAWFPKIVRMSTADNNTLLALDTLWQQYVGSAWQNIGWLGGVRVDAVDSSENILATAEYAGSAIAGLGSTFGLVQYYRFTPGSAIQVSGFKLTVGSSSGIDWALGPLFTTGHTSPTDSVGTAVGLPANEAFAVRGTSGYFTYLPGGPHAYKVVFGGSFSVAYVDGNEYTPYPLYYAYSTASQTARIKVLDSVYGDNEGPGIDWNLYHAYMFGTYPYRIYLNGAYVYNVCEA